MQINQQMLAQNIQKKIAPLYVLVGQDSYLLEESLTTIKVAIKKTHDCEEKIISVQTTEDWNNIKEEANSYSLFSETVLLNIFFDKKTLDAAAKKIISEYLQSINPRCHIIIRAPNLPAKQLQWLSSNPHAIVCVAYPLNSDAMKNWIASKLKAHSLHFDIDVPETIHQYTQGNMLACSQVIEKIVLCHLPGSKINAEQAREHLSNQCEYNLYELIDACLSGQGAKAIQILRHAASNKTEATLVLWMLTQEVRTITQLFRAQQNNIDFKTACAQLKIWPQRVNLYQSCYNRFKNSPLSPLETLQSLHRVCYLIDEDIKSSFNTPVWNSLESLTLSLCLGKNFELA